MKKEKFFIKKLSLLIRIQIIVLSILFMFFVGVSYSNAEKEMNATCRNYLEIYGNQLSARLDSMQKVMTRLLYNNTDLQMIQSKNEAQRLYASINLQREMAELLNIDSSVEYLIVADSSNDICLDAFNVQPLPEEKMALREYTEEISRQKNYPVQPWEVLKIGEKYYICKIAIQNHRTVAAYLSAESLLYTVKEAQLRNIQFLLTEDSGVVTATAGHSLFRNIVGKKTEDLENHWMISNSRMLLDGQLTLYGYEHISGVISQIKSGMFFMVLAILMLFVFSIHLKKYVEKELTDPMFQLEKSMERMRKGEYDLRIDIKTRYQEFALLSDTFNRLMDEIIGLKLAAYEKKLQLQEADQKYIRLQLRPHFFLNAMTTVLSLSTQGKNREIEVYIQALSKNIRYMFSSGLHTVSVKEEIRHVNNYIDMQELKYPGCIFHYVELPQQLEEWRIPQMLIHTLVENEYRYAVSKDSVLMLLIRISTERLGEEQMLKIEVEDDGKGYPQEVLEYMNGQSAHDTKDGTRVGLWSVRRLLELMYERNGLIKLSNVEPHGAKCLIYIPKKVVHEISNAQGHESGIS